MEGTGSYGAGLTRYLTEMNIKVLEVNRPNRQLRRRLGKTDTVDAIAAGRAVLNGEATARPKTGDGPVEGIRMLRVARRSAVKARTQAINQLHALVTAPEITNWHISNSNQRTRPKHQRSTTSTSNARGSNEQRSGYPTSQTPPACATTRQPSTTPTADKPKAKTAARSSGHCSTPGNPTGTYWPPSLTPLKSDEPDKLADIVAVAVVWSGLDAD